MIPASVGLASALVRAKDMHERADEPAGEAADGASCVSSQVRLHPRFLSSALRGALALMATDMAGARAMLAGLAELLEAP